MVSGLEQAKQNAKTNVVRGNSTMRVYSFKAEPQLMQRVAEYAEHKGFTVSEVIRRALKSYLEREARTIRTRRLRIY